uniref:Uncharacterized protein n=1 Tax=Schizaphis graminum TaxID=13262 RepID=A0A2S2NS10_SCHGA
MEIRFNLVILTIVSIVVVVSSVNAMRGILKIYWSINQSMSVKLGAKHTSGKIHFSIISYIDTAEKSITDAFVKVSNMINENDLNIKHNIVKTTQPKIINVWKNDSTR